MENSTYKFSTYFSSIFMSIFTCFIGVLAYLTIFMADEKNIFASITAISIFLICLLFTYYLWVNRLIIKEDKIIYIGFKKHVILKKDIVKVEPYGHHISIYTTTKKYNIVGYLISNRYYTDKNFNKNKHLIEVLRNYIKER